MQLTLKCDWLKRIVLQDQVLLGQDIKNDNSGFICFQLVIHDFADGPGKHESQI